MGERDYLGPESFYMSDGGHMYSGGERHYLLRPETVEFILETHQEPHVPGMGCGTGMRTI